MGSVRISVGTEWLYNGRVYRVTRQINSATVIAIDQKFQTESEFKIDEILKKYELGELSFANTDDGSKDRRRRKAVDLRDVADEDRKIAEQRWTMIEPLAKSSSLPKTSDFRERAKQLRMTGKEVSARSLRRYYDSWKRAGGSKLALLPRTRNCGGPGYTRSGGLLSAHSAITNLVDVAIREVYLTTARRPISAVVNRVLEDLQRLNSRLASDRAIPVPKHETLARAISRHIARLDSWEVDRSRWGRKIADQRNTPRVQQGLARRILERVEVDHSLLKVVVGTGAGPIGQPWLTVLIDYYSRMVVGFCLGFDPPSYAVLMEALRHSILPKSHVNEKFPLIRQHWPCFGIPERITCDRGADFTSKDLELAAFQLGFVLDFNPPRTPHLKGCVESFFGGLDQQLIAALPGRTFRSWEKRADHKPDEGPLLPYESLLEIIHVYLIDVYSQSKHPTISKTRLEVWEDSATEHPPFLPATPEELIVLLSRSTERALSNRGIELGGMFYTSDELMALRADLAVGQIQGDRMTVRYNPWNLGSIRVLNPVTGDYIRATAVDATMEGLTEFQWKVLKKSVRERFNAPDHQMTLAAGRNTIREIAEKTMTKPSRRRRKKAARFVGELRSAPLSKTETLSPADQQPSEEPDEIGPVSDFSVSELDDWGIGTTEIDNNSS